MLLIRSKWNANDGRAESTDEKLPKPAPSAPRGSDVIARSH